MITFRLYNKTDKKLIYRTKLYYSTDYPEEAIQQFAENLDVRSKNTYAHYSAIAKDGKIIAREACYKGL